VSIEAGGPVHVVGDDQFAPDGLRTSGEHGDVCTVGELQNLERIDDGVVESDIARCGHQAEDLKGLGRGQHHHEGRGLILPGIGSNNHLGWHRRIFADLPGGSEAKQIRTKLGVLSRARRNYP
jgi:hypothetical protein